jgi:hypothetical protein
MSAGIMNETLGAILLIKRPIKLIEDWPSVVNYFELTNFSSFILIWNLSDNSHPPMDIYYMELEKQFFQDKFVQFWTSSISFLFIGHSNFDSYF